MVSACYDKRYDLYHLFEGFKHLSLPYGNKAYNNRRKDSDTLKEKRQLSISSKTTTVSHAINIDHLLYVYSLCFHL